MSLTRKAIITLLLLSISAKIQCEDDDTETGLDDSKTDQILKDTGDVIEDTDIQNYEKLYNIDIEVTEVPPTTELIDSKEENATTSSIDVSEVTEDNTWSMTDNVYKHREDGIEDNDSKSETTTPPTTRATEEDEMMQQDEVETTGQRNPKTDNSELLPPDPRSFETKPAPLPFESKSSTLRGWLEDSWLRPPAALLVPLRPMALNRALQVWKDLTAEGLNVSDIVIVGYDSNGVNWRSRHNLQPSRSGAKDRDVSDALSKLLLKYQGVHSDTSIDGTMRALASAAKLVPYDSALFVITDKGAGDPQRLPLALRALVEKRLKVYTIWTNPKHPSPESEEALQELRNISRHTEGDVLPYYLQAMDVESPSNLALEAELQNWSEPQELKQARRGRVNSELVDKYDTLLVRRGGGEAISLGLPIESGVTALNIFIEGAVEHAVLYPPNEACPPPGETTFAQATLEHACTGMKLALKRGSQITPLAPQIDLYNKSSVAAFSPASRTEGTSPRNVYLIFTGSYTNDNMLTVLPATSSRPEPQSSMAGMWHLSVRCDTCDYRLCVTARSRIHLDIETETAEIARVRVTGPVASVRESLLVDEYGTELAKLSFSYQPITGDGQSMQVDPTKELVTDVLLPTFKEAKVYFKIVGRDVQGEPFVRLFGPLSQPEVRLGRSASITFPDDNANDLEAAEEDNSIAYSRLRYNDSNVLPFGRAVSQVVNQQGTILTAVQIGLSTRLYGAPGDSLQLHFEVTNYREQAVSFRFGAVGELRFLTGINPTSQTIASGQTVNVIVSLTITATAQPGSRDFITFTAYGVDHVSISAYVYVINSGGSQVDVWAPEVRHNFQGSCTFRQGDDCAQHVWSATVIAKDAVGGLLRLTSSPIGLTYDSNFISGTREEVVASYRSTCCAPRVLVTAVDAYGNVNTYIVDISNYLTEAAIAAIVLGVFLLIAMIILIGYLIHWCVKRRKESRELPYTTSSRNIS